MKKIAFLFSAISLLSWTTASAAAEHRNRYPTGIHMDNSRPCFFFYLDGVAQPDPAVSGPAFAIPRTHPAFAELVAIVLTARAAGQKIGVFTTGTSACGLAAVNLIVIEGVAGEGTISAASASSSLTVGLTSTDIQPQP
jgi:hypothetical protein